MGRRDSAVKPVVLVEGNALEDLIDELSRIARREPYAIRFAIDGGIKIKVDNGVWSPPLGQIEEE